MPEIADEDLVRAFLVIRANSVPFEAAEPEFMQLLVDLLNKRVTPVMYSRGTLGEGDLFLTSNFLATMVGRGDAYYRGVRMSAAAGARESRSQAACDAHRRRHQQCLCRRAGGAAGGRWAARRWNGRISSTRWINSA